MAGKKRSRSDAALQDKVNGDNRSGEETHVPPTVRLAKSAYPFHFPSRDTGVTGQRAFQWLLGSISVQDFFSEYFEKKPVLFQAPDGHSSRFECLSNLPQIRDLVFSKVLLYGTGLDVTHYSAVGGRETLNGPIGTLVGSEAWKLFQDEGCSIRMLRPQEHFEPVWAICSMLETFFGTMVGANVYLTPPSSQGFAPHFDDIDAFVCQVSGTKRWRVYGPRSDGHDVLPRHSSIDFTQEEMSCSKVVIDAVLRPGDMLYLPRGAVHQAECEELASEDKQSDGNETNGLAKCKPGGNADAGSLHITISACQKWTWADFLKETLEAAVQSAAAEHVQLRRTLPLRFTDYAGVGHAEEDEKRRRLFDKGVVKALQHVASSYPIDTAADVLAERFMRERLPPWDGVGTTRAAAPSGEAGARPSPPGGIGQDSWVRAVGRGIARVVMERDGELPVLVHCARNLRSGRAMDGRRTAADESRLSCTVEEGFAIDAILKAYPAYVAVRDIALDGANERVELAECLADLGLARVV